MLLQMQYPALLWYHTVRSQMEQLSFHLVCQIFYLPSVIWIFMLFAEIGIAKDPSKLQTLFTQRLQTSWELSSMAGSDGSNRSKSLGVRAMFGRNARHNAVKLKLSLKCSHYSQIGTTNIFFLKYHKIHTKIFHCVRNNI